VFREEDTKSDDSVPDKQFIALPEDVPSIARERAPPTPQPVPPPAAVSQEDTYGSVFLAVAVGLTFLYVAYYVGD
jgi:hypothetical protein